MGYAGVPLSGRQRVACSSKCRAARWRLHGAATQQAAPQARDREVRELLEAALKRLEER